MATAHDLVDALRHRGLTLCTAESCTGGGIGAAITAVAGASECFVGGIIAYANEIKEAMLGVSPEMLQQHGAVSDSVAVAMAQGARSRLNADMAVAVTGVAGPSGGTAEKPVGLVFAGLVDADGVEVRSFNFSGDREDVRRQTVCAAFDMIMKRIENIEGD